MSSDQPTAPDSPVNNTVAPSAPVAKANPKKATPQKAAHAKPATPKLTVSTTVDAKAPHTKSLNAKPTGEKKPASESTKPKAEAPAAKKIATAHSKSDVKTQSPTPTQPKAEAARSAANKPAPKKSTTKSVTSVDKPKPAVSVAATIVAPAPAPAPAPKKSASKTRKRKPLPPAIQGIRKRLPYFLQLMRLDKPIGTFLLLWPTLWALWLAAKGIPSWKNLVIFSSGVLIMRAAGCVINDFADRKIDGRVARTQDRPLATGVISSREALTLFITLCLLAFGLVLLTDPLTIKLSLGGLVLACSYPFMKRHTHLPQVVLGAAFAWGIPMAYAAETGALDKNMWLIYLAVVLWTVAYDTFYAMVDRNDDLKIGVKSTAILFGEQDRVITGALQAMVIYALILVGKAYNLGWVFYLSLVVVAGLFTYQQWLIRFRERQACFKAFLNNNWVGAAIFVGIAADFAFK